MSRKKTNLLPYEIWKDIPGYEGLYQVSTMGNVRSLERYYTSGNGVVRKTGGLLTFKLNYHGYFRVGLSKNGKTIYKFVHSLVAEVFIPNPFGFPQINHKNEVKTDNSVSNLEWCTAKYNSNYGHRTEKIMKTHYRPVVQKTLDGKIVRIWENIIMAQEYVGNNRKSTVICGCLNGRKKTAYGYKWEYYYENDI